MMKERLLMLIKELGISGRQFSKMVGKSEGWLNSVTKSIGSDILTNILDTYPNVNMTWVLSGQGEMFLEDSSVVKEDQGNYQINKDYKSICEDLRNDNKDLREENKKLRDTLLELMYKNEKLMVENVQLHAKFSKE